MLVDASTGANLYKSMHVTHTGAAGAWMCALTCLMSLKDYSLSSMGLALHGLAASGADERRFCKGVQVRMSPDLRKAYILWDAPAAKVEGVEAALRSRCAQPPRGPTLPLHFGPFSMIGPPLVS